MNIKQAKYIKTIADCGTVTAAAKMLYVSQPSLSQMLRQVEEELGMPIFDRSVSPMILTFAGEKYMQAANQILTANEQLETQIRELKNERSGRIRLGISVSRGIQILPKLLPMFQAEYPEVVIELLEASSGELEEALTDGKLDLALAAIEPTSHSIVYELLEKESIGILAGRESSIARKYPSGTPLPLIAASKDHFVSLTKGHSSRSIQDQLFRRYDFYPKILLETDSLEIGRRVTMEANACMVLPSAYLDDYIRHMGGEFFPLADYVTRRHFYACTRKGDFVPQYIRDLTRMVGKVLEDRPTPASLE